MTFNKEVCNAFFNFDSTLNKGHGIVSSIYSIINRKRNSNEIYFQSLETRIEREAISCKTVKQFLDLLSVCWANLPDEKSKWYVVAYLFFVTDKVDKLCQNTLPLDEYNQFKSNATILLYHELDLRFENELDETAWDIFNISENLFAIPVPVFDILLGCAAIYSLYHVL